MGSAKRTILQIWGFFFLGLGILGAVLPIMPTTPFVLVSAACFYRSNKRIHKWLNNSRYFGPYIENYHTGQGVNLSLKLKSIIAMGLTLIISIIIVQTAWALFLLGVVGICVTIHLLLIKTKKQ